MAMLVTQIATAVAAFSWMLVEWGLKGKPTVVGICSGAVAGLVAITPASGFVGPVGAFAIGIAAGVFCYWGCTGLKRIFSYDDALDCFGIHAVGGIVGALLTGVFAVEQYGGTAGVLEGNVAQFFNQCIGVATVFVYDAVASLIILFVVNMLVGLRVTEEHRTRRSRPRAARRGRAVAGSRHRPAAPAFLVGLRRVKRERVTVFRGHRFARENFLLSSRRSFGEEIT